MLPSDSEYIRTVTVYPNHTTTDSSTAMTQEQDESTEEEIFKVQESTLEDLEPWRIFAITSAIGGCYLGWGVQVGNGTRVLLDLGCSAGFTSFVWLLGPISGITMAPIVG